MLGSQEWAEEEVESRHWSQLSSHGIDGVDRQTVPWRDGMTADVHQVSLGTIDDILSAFQTHPPPHPPTTPDRVHLTVTIPLLATLLGPRVEAGLFSEMCWVSQDR